ncbi:MAG: hypothetical protein C0503_08870 [Gemmatimonas sp.]|nr:hypothetical protein [Gemmatimonas sp.]
MSHSSRQPWSTPLCLRMLTGITLVATGLALPPAAAAQSPASQLSRADSTLLYEVLSAEDRRDSTSAALAAGEMHRDPRIAAIARRARARLRDSTFAARDVLGQPDASRGLPTWPEPEWAGRFRALGGREGDCAPLIAAFSDSAVQVRQRAITLSGQRRSCAGNDAVATRLQQFIETGVQYLQTNGRSRRPGQASWHHAAEALVSLSRVAPEAAAAQRRALVAHPSPFLRRAVARSAAITGDTAALRALLRDSDGNVQEAAIRGLSSLVGLAAADEYRRFIGYGTPQVALAAAEALKDARDSVTLRAAAQEGLRRTQRNHASERDIRDALRAIVGLPPERWSPGRRDSLPWDAVALALGERRFVGVTMSRLHGGSGFTVELRGDVAPIQAARVLAQVRAGGYNGNAWHRVEPNFVIQGGSPHDNEYSGSARFVVDELSTIAHPRGSVGMSTRGHSTGDLQWFVNLRDNARLTGAYTVFAVVVEGMDAVDAVMEGDEIYVMREVSAPRPSRP